MPSEEPGGVGRSVKWKDERRKRIGRRTST